MDLSKTRIYNKNNIRLYNALEMQQYAEEFHRQAEQDLPDIIHKALNETILPDIEWAAKNGSYSIEKNYRQRFLLDVTYEEKLLDGAVEILKDRGFKAAQKEEGILNVSWEV